MNGVKNDQATTNHQRKPQGVASATPVTAASVSKQSGNRKGEERKKTRPGRRSQTVAAGQRK
jgi:hypothetical protein